MIVAPPPLSSTRLAAIFALLRLRHFSVPEIATRLGLNPAHLRAYMRRAGIRLPVGRLPRVTDPPPEDLCLIAFAPLDPDTLVTPPPLPGEEWRFVARNHHYAVSSFGRVCRVTPFTATHPGRELHARIDKDGKATVTLGDVTATVASLVAGVFLAPPPSGTALFHKDFDGTNNRVTNLAYATRREITLAAFAHHDMQGERNPHARLSDADVQCIRTLYGERSARQIAAEYGIARGTVYQIQSWRVRGTSGVRARRNSTLGARIRQVRRQYTLSAAAMAKELGVTPSAVTAWERGDKTPRYPARIAALLAQVEAARMPSHTDGEEAVRTDTPAPPPRIRRSVLPVSRDSHATESMWHVTTE